MINARKTSGILSFLSVLMLNCGGSSDRRISGTAGAATGVGGGSLGGTVASNGGGALTGGSRGVGGSLSAGGTSVVGSGSLGGGTFGTGGADGSGGLSAAGGDSSPGGSLGGGALGTGSAMATGGANATGGTTTGGDAPATGGLKGTGGMTGVGGTANVGGTSAVGGASGTGGGNPALCGNHTLDTGEGCDDGNSVPGDGCSPLCQLEPTCTAGNCTSVCGDGVVAAGEACDDGNIVSGDGCSSACQTESGYTCTQSATFLDLPIVYRDFRTGGDFEPAAVSGINAPTQGLVQTTLDSDGKPIFVGTAGKSYITSSTSFGTWYRDTSGKNSNYTTTLKLWSDDGVTFGNRWGSNGDRYVNYSTVTYCDTSSCSATACAGAAGQACFYPCTPLGAGYTYACLATVNKLDGNPLFFPLDNVPNMITPASEYLTAMIPPPFASYWMSDPSGVRHNFSFTSELKFWFYYQAGQPYTIDFLGDDDVWVFVNRHLALDLGGLHTEVRGHLDIAADGSGKVLISQAEPSPPPAALSQTVSLGLEDGHVYEVAVFHAERKSTGSAYAFTASGLGMSPSRCSQ